MHQPATILVVDDQPEIVENLAMVLESEGYYVQTAADGIEAFEKLESQPVDLIIADIAMPRMNGYQLYERVRENPAWLTVPFIFLTARALDSDIRYGKQLGVDDYLTKPIQPEDLLAVVEGRLKRARQLADLGAAASSAPQSATSPGTIDLGQLRIDPRQHRVWMGDQPVKLSAREFILLETMARRVGQVLSPEELILATHDLETDKIEAGSLLRPLIRSLRRKLGYDVGQFGCIENIRGVGYRLIRPTET
ncbi:MAG: response regulator transcription factor [Anaerolineae bacterium]|jgi:DNA-binding response OmpR family regulator